MNITVYDQYARNAYVLSRSQMAYDYQQPPEPPEDDDSDLSDQSDRSEDAE